jgi:inosine-uridine nucleoside N-ribohydrolase
MQLTEQAKPPVGVVFDCNMGQRIDTALALALLYGFDGREEARLVAVSVSKSNLKAAAFCEVLGRFYAGSVSGGFGFFRRSLPVGLSTDGLLPEDTPMLAAPLAKVNSAGQPVYSHGIEKLTDTAETTALIRNAFTAQHDQNCIVILAGPATNLVKVLDLPGAKDLIAAKVRCLTVSAGAYPEGGPELNIQTDIPAAKKLFAEWPTPIAASGHEVGGALHYPASSIEKDFTWTENHPVVDAYRAYRAMPYDAPAWDMAAVLYAIRPDANYFNLSEPGTINVFDDGRTRFTPSTGGRHRYLILDPARKEQIIRTFIEIASAKPVVRERRRRPPVQQQQQQQPAAQPKPATP